MTQKHPILAHPSAEPAPRSWLNRRPPRWLFRLLVKLRWLHPPPAKALADAASFLLPQCMYVAARLRVSERLRASRKSGAELAAELGVDGSRLSRLLYALEQQGYYRRTKRRADPGLSLEDEWANTDKSATLAEDHPNSIRPILCHWIEDCYSPSHRLIDAITDGKSAFSHHHAGEYEGFFENYLPKNPSQNRQFSDAMTATNSLMELALISDFPWGKFHRVVDVGGAHGAFLQKIMEVHPHLRGVLFDLPEVIEGVLDDSGAVLNLPFDVCAGSFFEVDSIPEIGGSEAFLMRNILHDWSDDDCQRILAALRRRMVGPDARLVLVELGLAMDPSGHPLEATRSQIDILMLSMFDGRERTLEDLRGLLRKADFTIHEVRETRSLVRVIEAGPSDQRDSF